MEKWVFAKHEFEKNKETIHLMIKLQMLLANGEVELTIKVKTKQCRRNKMDWIIANWEWIMLGFYTLEKIVKLSPSKKDDIIFDAVIKPVWDKLPFGK